MNNNLETFDNLLSLSNFNLFRLVLEEFGIEIKDENDIAGAWQLVEKLRLFVMPWGNDEWCAATHRDERLAFQNIFYALTAPLAICYTALITLGRKE